MEKSKRKKVIYTLISFLTLIIPVPVYLLVMACVFNITPNYTFNKDIRNEITYVVKEDINFLILPKSNDYVVEGDLLYFNEDNTITLPFTEETIFKIEKLNYYKVEIKNKVLTWENYDSELFEKTLSYKIPASLIVSIASTILIALIIFKKMGFAKKHPRLSVLLALSFGTFILLLLETLVSSMLDVFLVATITWLVYCLEYIIYNHKEIFNDKINTNELIGDLNKKLGGGK